MAEKKYLIALDQGTTSSRALILTHDTTMVAIAQKEIEQLYPNPGWVQHRAMDDWTSLYECVLDCMKQIGASWDEIAGIGLTNQRETAVCWRKDNGEPLYNSIIWQSRQSTPICDRWIAEGHGPKVLENTGLTIDAYFSASKVVWMCENVPGFMDEVKKGNVCFGNIDTWITWNFSKGAYYVTEPSNASRSMMFNIRSFEWDRDLIHNVYGIPEEMNFPKVVPSVGIMGYTHPDLTGGIEIPIGGCLGDQQAGTFGQVAFEPMTGKITYGTAGVVDINIGSEPIINHYGIPTTIGWEVEGKRSYLTEAVLFNCGVMIQWCRDGLKIIDSAPEIGPLAESVPNTKDFFMVPAMVGLCSPYWDPRARTAMVGITAGVGRAEIARACLEGIAYSIKDCAVATEKGLPGGQKITAIKVDGGACRCDFLMQFQADILGASLMRPKQPEATAMGAAFAGGLGVGFWKDMAECKSFWALDKQYDPKMSEDQRETLYARWLKAVEHAKDWAQE